VIRRRLHALADELRDRFPGETFRVCVDTAPLLEREYAQRAGIGAVGKHTLIIERGVGSYLLLGEIVTTLELQPGEPATADPCGTCTRCIEACPTDAITPWSVDATKCISYLTIEHRSAIDERYHEPMGDWIFGCDICQEVCPHNQPTERTRAARSHEAYEPRRSGFDLLEVLNWSEQDRIRAFTKSAMKRVKLWMMKRNALIVAGNVLCERDVPELRERIEQIAGDDTEQEIVRSTAHAVLRHLSGDHSGCI
jgi:epoxyqueuosine reductase